MTELFGNYNQNLCLKNFKKYNVQTNKNGKQCIAVENVWSEGPKSLLAVLDDKNRMIEILKLQLMNQKAQLSFYLHNGLGTQKIFELSKTCSNEVVDDSIPLTLALSNFYKKTGVKSRIMSLHDRMIAVDKRITEMVERQENLCHKIIEILMECSNYGSPDEDNSTVRILRVCADCDQFTLFNEILHSTIGLRKELETFRVCCDRLITIEDERNNIVDQVYSTPATQRINFNYLIAYQIEKRRLETEMEEIRKEQKELEEKVVHQHKDSSSLPDVRQTPENMISSTEELFTGTQLQKMLEVINSDAKEILHITKSQKDKYANEIANLMGENTALKEKVCALEQIVHRKEEIFDKIKEVENHYVIVIEDLQKTHQKEIKEKGNDIANLHKQVKCLKDENLSLQSEIKKLGKVAEQVEDLNLHKQKCVELSKERDDLKLEVENLKSVRAALSNIVDHYEEESMNKCDYSELEQAKQKLRETEKRRDELFSDVIYLKESFASQQVQIRQLLYIIEKISEAEPVNCLTGYDSVPNEIYTPLNKNELNEVSDYPIAEKDHSFPGLDHAGDKKLCTSPDKMMNPETYLLPSIPTQANTFEILTTDKHGNVESVKAIVHCSSNIEGLIKIENVPNLSLQLKCTPGHAEDNIKRKPSKEFEDNVVNEQKHDLSDSELMKDCSEETILIECPPCSARRQQSQIPSHESINITQIYREKTYNILDNSSQSKEITSPKRTKTKTKISNVSHALTYNINEYQKNSEFSERIRAETNITEKLKIITSELDNRISQPEGRTTIINTLKEVFNNSNDVFCNEEYDV